MRGRRPQPRSRSKSPPPAPPPAAAAPQPQSRSKSPLPAPRSVAPASTPPPAQRVQQPAPQVAVNQLPDMPPPPPTRWVQPAPPAAPSGDDGTADMDAAPSPPQVPQQLSAATSLTGWLHAPAPAPAPQSLAPATSFTSWLPPAAPAADVAVAAPVTQLSHPELAQAEVTSAAGTTVAALVTQPMYPELAEAEANSAPADGTRGRSTERVWERRKFWRLPSASTSPSRRSRSPARCGETLAQSAAAPAVVAATRADPRALFSSSPPTRSEAAKAAGGSPEALSDYMNASLKLSAQPQPKQPPKPSASPPPAAPPPAKPAAAAPPAVRQPTLSASAVLLGYFTEPPLDVLLANPAALRCVDGFVVGAREVGKVRFLAPVDLSDGPVLDEVVHLARGVRAVGLYDERGGGPAAPPRGTRLNVPFEASLLRVFSRNGTKTTPEQFAARLKRVPHTRFVAYDAADGTWRFRCNGALMDGEDSEEDA